MREEKWAMPTTKHEWRFEPRDPDGVRDNANKPYEHAVQGIRPKGDTPAAGRHEAWGYAHDLPTAYERAKEGARHVDANEQVGQVGQRGESKSPLVDPMKHGPYMQSEWRSVDWADYPHIQSIELSDRDRVYLRDIEMLRELVFTMWGGTLP
jgi:hypothetical protein